MNGRDPVTRLFFLEMRTTSFQESRTMFFQESHLSFVADFGIGQREEARARDPSKRKERR